MLTLITGASAGLGAEMARQFAARGHDLILTARRVDKLEAVREEILATHSGCSIAVEALDVTDDDEVFRVFAEHAPLERVIVNAGLGYAKLVGTGGHARNREIAMTNFVGALAQIDAAMQQFRRTGCGHLVVISSFAAVRGLQGSPAVYAATKRGIAHLAEGLRSETLHTDVDVTVVYPGYIESDMTAELTSKRFTVDTTTGVRVMVNGIERRRATVYAPTLPWLPLSLVMRLLPVPLLSRFTAPPT